jgi:hypothetical protein
LTILYREFVEGRPLYDVCTTPSLEINVSRRSIVVPPKR